MTYTIQYELEAHWIGIAHCYSIGDAYKVYDALRAAHPIDWRIVETESRAVIAWKYAEITVTMEVKYLVPMFMGTSATEINGWTVERVIQDWFHDHDINSHHATRDSHRLGNGSRVVKIEHSVKEP